MSSLDLTLSGEIHKTTSRAVVADDGTAHADLNRIANALRAFAQELGTRLAPQAMADGGVPRPEDLVDLMTRAVERAREMPIPEIPSNEADDDSFEM